MAIFAPPLRQTLQEFEAAETRVIGDGKRVKVSGKGIGLGVWKTWTPTYANISVGNGTVVARYVQIGDKFRAQYMLTFGSTTTMGTAHTISLPVTADTSFTASRLNLGPAILFEDGTAVNHGFVKQNSSTTVTVVVFNAASTYLQGTAITATVPFTWGTSDILSFNISGEAA